MYGIYANIWGILMVNGKPYIPYMDSMGLWISLHITMISHIFSIIIMSSYSSYIHICFGLFSQLAWASPLTGVRLRIGTMCRTSPSWGPREQVGSADRMVPGCGGRMTKRIAGEWTGISYGIYIFLWGTYETQESNLISWDWDTLGVSEHLIGIALNGHEIMGKMMINLIGMQVNGANYPTITELFDGQGDDLHLLDLMMFHSVWMWTWGILRFILPRNFTIWIVWNSLNAENDE